MRKVRVGTYVRRKPKGGRVKVKSYSRKKTKRSKGQLREMQKKLIARTLEDTNRPLTVSDLRKPLRMHPQTLEKYLTSLEKEGRIRRLKKKQRTYWKR